MYVLIMTIVTMVTVEPESTPPPPGWYPIPPGLKLPTTPTAPTAAPAAPGATFMAVPDATDELWVSGQNKASQRPVVAEAVPVVESQPVYQTIGRRGRVTYSSCSTGG